MVLYWSCKETSESDLFFSHFVDCLSSTNCFLTDNNTLKLRIYSWRAKWVEDGHQFVFNGWFDVHQQVAQVPDPLLYRLYQLT